MGHGLEASCKVPFPPYCIVCVLCNDHLCPHSDSEVRSNVFKSLMLNTVSLVSIYFFDWLLLPLAQSQQKWFHRNIGWFYQVLWLLPVVGISFYLNVSTQPHIPSSSYPCGRQHDARTYNPHR